MKTLRRKVKGLVKGLVEEALGVRIYGVGPYAPSRDFYFHLPQFRSWSPTDVVFDVGANDGRSVLAFLEVLPSPRIYAFEPISSTFQTLVQRTEHLDNVRCFPLALGSEKGRETMYLGEKAVWNSFSPTWKADHVGTETVEVATVDQVMAEQGVEFVHFLKIDTEGHDLEVLRGAEGALSSSRIAIIQVEVRFDKPGADLESFRRYLGPMGYHFYGLYNPHYKGGHPPSEWTAERADGYAPKALYYCDAVFMAARL